MRTIVEAMDLPVVEAPAPGRRPSSRAALALTEAVRHGRFDIVHGYEWPPTMEAAYGPHVRCSTPVVSTVMSMAVAPFLPRHLPLVVGTELIRDSCAVAGFSRVKLLEPPVDIVANAPRPRPRVFASQWGIAPGQPVVVVVSRLAEELKKSGLLEAVQAVGELPAALGARLMVVGDGPARPEVEERARLTNSTCGREVVTLTGELLDPRPAYALADVLLGMGSSVLRGMAFEKGGRGTGRGGFWSVVSPATLPMFLRQGWYGLGDGSSGTARLMRTLLDLLSDEQARRELGTFSRRVVRDRFSLERAAVLQEAVHEESLARRYEQGRTASMTRASAGLVGCKVRRCFDRWRGQAAVDDFNARRVQPAAPERVPA